MKDQGRNRTSPAKSPANKRVSRPQASHSEPSASGPEKPKRMTLSQVVEAQLGALVSRGGRGASSVSLTRNARGYTQIEVSIYTGEGGLETPDEAAEVARRLYDELRERYPYNPKGDSNKEMES